MNVQIWNLAKGYIMKMHKRLPTDFGITGVKIRRLAFYLGLALAGVPAATSACNLSSIALVGTPVDNGNGTFTFTVNVCVAIDVSWGGTTDFTIAAAGGSFTSIASIQTGSFNTSYNYCSQTCFGGVCFGSTLSGGCSSPIVNSGSFLNFTGCGNSPGNWIAPDDYDATCVPNPQNICQDVVFTTNGYPSTFTMDGVEDDVGPDVGSGGCLEVLSLPPQPGPPITIDGCSGSFYDTGGPSGNYSNNENYEVTYCSDNGGPVIVTFNSFSVEGGGGCPYDYLLIYDGPTSGSPYLAGWCGTGSIPSYTSSGTCLTFVFISDNSVTYPGWDATISCPCTPPSASFTSNSPQCVGSGFNFNNTGSTGGGWTYNWTFPSGSPSSSTQENPGGISWSSAGTYGVTLEICSSADPFCCTQVTQNITVGGGPTVTASATPASCFGDCDGTVSAVGSGGTPPYSFFWSGGLDSIPNVTNVCAGTYTVVIIDALGCTSQGNTQVTQPNPIDLFAVPTDETCTGACDGLLWAATTGGVAPFTFTWNNGLGTGQGPVGVCPGTYTVTVVDANGCVEQNTLNSTATVNPGAAIAAGFTYNGNQCLSGNNFCFTNSGSMGATYSWNFGDGSGTSTAQNPCYTYTSAGTFTVTQTVTNGPCSATATAAVNVFSPPAGVVSGTNPSCSGSCNGSANLTVSGGTSPYTYSWSNSSGTEDISGLCAGSYSVTISDANGCQGTASVNISDPPPLTVSVTGGDASCNGVCDGSATATPSGGSAPYTYSWDDPGFQNTQSATGLCAVPANVTVTDAGGCTTTGSYTVSEPAPMTLTPAAVNATCGLSDGSVSVTAAGGSGPYTYAWTGGCVTSSCTGLASGSYSVTVSDINGCTQLTAAVISDGGGGAASAVVNNNASCFGACDGQATASISGGTAPFTYLWDDPAAQSSAIATGLCAGTFGVVVTDAGGCAGAASVNITQPPALNPSVTTTNNATCNGLCDGTATISVSGGTGGYTYSWTPSGGSGSVGTGLCAGTTYTVNVTDANGCTASAVTSVGEPTAMSLTIAPVNPLCPGAGNGSANLTVTGGTPSYNYLWTGSVTTEDLTNIFAGNYAVTVTDDNGCTATANTSLVDPSPVTAAVSVVDASCGLANGSACVTPAGGNAPYTYSWNDTLFQTTTCAVTLPSGSYAVTVTDGNGCSATANAVVNNLPGANATASLVSNASAFGVCDGVAAASMPGTSPFTYLWDDPGAQTVGTAIGLCAGNYCVTVTDAAGCSDVACIVITEPNAITITVTGSNNTCFGNCAGTATVTAGGGTTPYSYLWSGPNSFSSANQNLSGLCAGTYNITLTDANAAQVTGLVTITEPPPVTAATGGTDVLCSGNCDGTASVTAGGGTPPYSYVWSDGFAQTTATAVALCAQNYSVTVTDASGCTATGSVTVNQPAPVLVTVTSLAAACGASDGSIIATVTNGTGPYTYAWDTPCSTSTCSGLPSGPYAVTVTDVSGCTVSGSANIADAGGPTLIMNDSADVSCYGGNDGSATAAVADGTPPYTYAWSTSPVQTTLAAWGLAAGYYSILVIDDNGCAASIGVNISQPPQLVAVASGTDPACNGGTNGVVTSNVTGGTGSYTYAWTGGCTTATCGSLGNGTYNLTVSDVNGCSASTSVSLTAPPAMGMLITGVDVTCGGLCNGSATALASGGVTPYTYSWSNGDDNQMADSLCAGSVTLAITDANGCLASSSGVIAQPAPVVVTISNYNDINCNGNCNGYAQASVTGGVAPHTYLWSTGSPNDQITGLCSGTYSLTVTDNNGCMGTTTVTISEPLPLTLSLNSTNIACYGSCNGTASVTASGGISPYSFLWNDGAFQTTMTATGLCAGPYSVTVTDSKGCSNSTSLVLTQPQQIALTATSVSSTCGNPNGSASVSVTGGVFPYTIQWNDPAQTIGNSISGVNAGVYICGLYDGNGCYEAIQVLINDIAGPAIDSVTTIDPPCYGSATGLATVYPSGGTQPYTFYWQNLAGDTIGPDSSFLSGLSGGSYTVAVRDANACLMAQIFVINEPLQLASAITGYANISCYGQCNGSATVAVGNGTPPYSYYWIPSTSTGPTATGLCAGLNNVQITDANGCQTSNSVQINQPTALVPSIAGTNITCNGQTDGSISVSVTGGSTPYNYQWLPGGTGNGTTVYNLGIGSYTVIITDINGCDTVQTMNISQPSSLVVTGGSSPSNCGAESGQAYVFAAGGTPPYSYTWYTGGGIPIGQVNDTALGLLQGSYSCEIEDNHGCSFQLPVSVNDNAGPVVSYESSVDVLCYGTSTGEASVDVTGNPPYTYLWEDGQQTKTATGLASGMYTVTVTDINGCMDSIEVTITEPAQLVVSASGAATICIGQTTQLSAVAGGGVAPYTYSWDNGGPGTSVFVVNPTDTTTYTVTVVDANGCTASNSVVVAVYPPLVANALGDSICEGENAVITCQGSGGTGVVADYTYTWLDTNLNPILTGISQTISNLTADTVFVAVFGDNCSPNDTVPVIVSVSPIPPPPVVLKDTIYCLGQIMDDLSAAGQGIVWYADMALSTQIGTGGSFAPLSAIGGTAYFATQTIDGCESQPGSVTVTVNPLPEAGFFAFPTEAPITNAGITFTDDASMDVVSWLWAFGDGDSSTGDLSNFSNGDTVLHLYSDSGYFVVYQIVVNVFGCLDTATDTIRITNEYILFAPAAFTPDGNGTNDYFLPKGIGIKEGEFKFYVFDRWGDLIYEHEGTYTGWLGWDGRANDGKAVAQEDVYVWMVRTEDLAEETHEYVGHVTLLR